jgi:poly(glycerol-phosphate) alpha-glucosyltransferase
VAGAWRGRVLHVTESLAANFGGTAAACAQLANHLLSLGIEVSTVSLDGHDQDARWRLAPQIEASRCRVTGSSRLGYSPDLMAALASGAPPDVVHLHGLWRLYYRQAAQAASRRGVPILITVNGMLHARALEQRSGLKRAARWLYQDRVLRGAECLHATASDEADQIRQAGFHGPIAVVPWGVAVPPPGGAGSAC